MGTVIGTITWKDETTAGVLTSDDEPAKIIWVNVMVNGHCLCVLTKAGKDMLSSINARPLKVDLELPIDFELAQYTDVISAKSDLYVTELHNILPADRDKPNDYFVDMCRLTINKMIMDDGSTKGESPHDLIERIMHKCSTSDNGMVMFGMRPVRTSGTDGLRWSSKIEGDIREMLVTRLESMGITTETVASALLCNDIIAGGLLRGDVEMSVGRFLILCKLIGSEPQDVMNAMVKNNAGFLRGLDSEES